MNYIYLVYIHKNVFYLYNKKYIFIIKLNIYIMLNMKWINIYNFF